MRKKNIPIEIINSAGKFVLDVFRKAQQIERDEIKSKDRLQNSETQKRIDSIRDSINSRSRAEK